MNAKKGQVLRYAFLLLCSVVLIVCSVIILNQKEGLFLDEYSSYGCANGADGKVLPFENGVTYSQEEVHQMELDTYGVKADERFRFDYVWQNLKSNVHPPVFYALLHIVCSLTPGVFTLWQAAAVNLFFGLITLIFLQKIYRAFFSNEWLSGILMLGWVCTLAHYADLVFLRDYAAATCGTVMVTWECLCYLRGNRKIPDLIKIGLASALCALSHYYCLIYLFFLCAVLVVILMARKEWKSILGVVLAEIVAAGVSIAVFPAMLTRIFSSGRGVQSTENLLDTDISSLGDRISYFYKNLNQSTFGTLLPYIGVLLAVLALIFLLMWKNGKLLPPEASDTRLPFSDLALIFLPTLFFTLMIIKIAALVHIKYLYPVTGLWYLSAALLLTWVGKRLLPRKVLAVSLTVVMFLMSCLSWPMSKFSFLYIGTTEKMTAALEPHQGIAAVQIWDSTKSYHCVTLPQNKFYRSTTFYFKPKTKALKTIAALEQGEDVIILLGKDMRKEGFIDQLLEYYPGYTATELGCLDGQNRFYNYFLHRE